MLREVLNSMKPAYDVAFPYIDAYLKTALILGIVRYRDALELYSLTFAAILVTMTVAWTIVRLMKDWEGYKKSKRENDEDHKKNIIDHL